jgi:alpha-galactosidase
LRYPDELATSASEPKALIPVSSPETEIIARFVDGDITLDAEHVSPQWHQAEPVSFCSDWQGKNPDPDRTTTVRLLWSRECLYLRFDCRYRNLYMFDTADPNGRRDHLWDRDVAEVFLQPDPSQLRRYSEFEVSPNGMWIDLDIFPGGRSALNSGMQRSVWLDRTNRQWVAELRIPMPSLTRTFDPSARWRANFYRIEGDEPRTYLAWSPTCTAEPNFHVPEAFGALGFAR